MEPAREYLTREDIPIKRVPYVSWLPHFIAKKLRFYTGIKDYLQKVQPDIIFLHDCQFLSIFQIANYAKQHKNVKIYADSHTDFINSGKTWVSKNIFHKIIYRLFCANVIAPYTTKFYGTLPVRVDFLRDIYGIDAQKIRIITFWCRRYAF